MIPDLHFTKDLYKIHLMEQRLKEQPYYNSEVIVPVCSWLRDRSDFYREVGFVFGDLEREDFYPEMFEEFRNEIFQNDPDMKDEAILCFSPKWTLIISSPIMLHPDYLNCANLIFPLLKKHLIRDYGIPPQTCFYNDSWAKTGFPNMENMLPITSADMTGFHQMDNESRDDQDGDDKVIWSERPFAE